jgi:hypothetical protein
MSLSYWVETTDYSKVGYKVPETIYIFDKTKWMGYITSSGWRYDFSQPFYFSKKGRTFKKVKLDKPTWL